MTNYQLQNSRNELQAQNESLLDQPFVFPMVDPEYEAQLDHSIASTVCPNKKYSPCKIYYTQLILQVLANGLLGGLTLCISSGLIIIEYLYQGHLKDSKLFISSISSLRIWMYIGYLIFMSFNSGQGICIRRCKAQNDWQNIRHFYQMNIKCFVIASIQFVGYMSLQYFVLVEKLYNDHDRMVSTMKTAILYNAPTFLIFALADLYRNLFIGLGVDQTISILIEFASLLAMAIGGLYGGFSIKKGFIGIESAQLVTSIIQLSLYYAYYRIQLFKNFKTSENLLLTEGFIEEKNQNYDDEQVLIEAVKSNASIIVEKDVIYDEDYEKHLATIKSYTGYLAYCLSTTISAWTIILNNNVNKLVTSLLFNNEIFSAISTIDNIFFVIQSAFSISFGLVITSSLSQLISKGLVRQAKIIASFYFLVTTTLALFFCGVFYTIVQQNWLGFFNNDIICGEYIRDLSQAVCILCPVIVICSTLFAICRAIDKELLFSFLIGFNFVFVQLVGYWMFLQMNQGYKAPYYALIVHYFVICSCGVGIVYMTDWKYQAVKIIKKNVR